MTRLEPAPRSDRPAGDEPEGGEPEAAARPPVPRRGVGARPTHVALVVVFATALMIALGPVNDIDSYWHVAVGREILARHTVSGLGRQWLGVAAGPWSTSQWLSEIGMYGAVDRFSWLALPVLRMVAAVALYAALWVTLVRRRQPIAAFVVVLGVVVGVQELLQDRPATVSLVFLALLGGACERLWVQGRRPSLLLVALTSLLWAQLHGLWVLAPAAFALVAVGGLMERRRAPERRAQVRDALLCAAASLAGVVSPVGPASFLLPLRFRGAAGQAISEWAPTNFTLVVSVAWGVLLVLLVLAWARAGRRVRATELLWMLAWTVFGLAAIRNVGPALLLTAPVVLRALERAAGSRLDALSPAPRPRVARALAALAAAIAVGAAAVLAVTAARLDPLERTPALAIARRLAAAPGPLRVWDSYNTSGALVAFGGGSDGHLLLVVDGRADLWGSTWIHDVGTTAELGDAWRSRFFGYHPDAAVLPATSPLATVLTTLLPADERWREVSVPDRDSLGWVLLVPPGSRVT